MFVAPQARITWPGERLGAVPRPPLTRLAGVALAMLFGAFTMPFTLEPEGGANVDHRAASGKTGRPR